MNVTLVSYTPDALLLLLRTKNTRLGAGADDPAYWPHSRQMAELAYMRDTIRSSWEFVDYTFHISGVTRAFTHQLVRTRSASYAQESQRAIDLSERLEFDEPDSVLKYKGGGATLEWDKALDQSEYAYKHLIRAGIPPQDARGILPTATKTALYAKFNLRTLSEMAAVRLCTRTQGEYQRVFSSMKTAILAVHPWADAFLQVHCGATGTCCFPNYGKERCSLYRHTIPVEALRGAAAAVRAEVALRFRIEESNPAPEKAK